MTLKWLKRLRGLAALVASIGFVTLSYHLGEALDRTGLVLLLASVGATALYSVFEAFVAVKEKEEP